MQFSPTLHLQLLPALAALFLALSASNWPCHSHEHAAAGCSSSELRRCGTVPLPFPFYNLECHIAVNYTGGHAVEGFGLSCPKSANSSLVQLPHLVLQNLQQNRSYSVLSFGHGEITIDPVPSAAAAGAITSSSSSGSNSSCSGSLSKFNLSDSPYSLSRANNLQLYNCTSSAFRNSSYQCSSCQAMLTSSSNYHDKLKHDHGRCTAGAVTHVQGSSAYCLDLNSSTVKETRADRNQLSTENLTAGYRSLVNFYTRLGCSDYFTSCAVSRGSQTVRADYGLRLDWRIKGNCSLCAGNQSAVCSRFDGGLVLCKCKPGFKGDGYAGGDGCVGSSEAAPAGKSSSRGVIKTAALTAGIVAIATIILAIAVAAALVIIWRSRRIPYNAILARLDSRRGDHQALAELASRSEIFSYRQLERATKGFAESEKLGTGACGAVYAGTLPGNRRVAVKRVHQYSHRYIRSSNNIDTQQLQMRQIVNELNVLSRAKHPNLVRLLGSCIEAVHHPLLVFEIVPNGTLAEHLEAARAGHAAGLDWTTRLTVAAEAAAGLAHLHAMQPPVVHRDVKSRNILLDRQLSAKLADFGLSRATPSSSGHVCTAPQGTPGYLDPDYHQSCYLSDKSDVYSFGVVLMEIITALKPVDFSRDRKEVTLASLALAKIRSASLDDILDPSLHVGRRPHVRAMAHRVAELAFRCLAFDKDARPSMAEVLEELLLIRGEGAGPPSADVSGSSSWSAPASGSSDVASSSSRSESSDRFLVDPRPSTSAN